MKYNSALCFALCGAGAAVLTGRDSRWASSAGAVAAIVGLLTLLEYIVGVNLRLDELFMHDYVLEGTVDPGRMSPLTAACFVSMGLGIAVVGLNPSGRCLR